MLYSFGMPGPMELGIIAAIMLLLFGNRLPSVMRSLGSSITSFKRGMNEVSEIPEEIRKETRELEKEIRHAGEDKK